MYQSYGDTRQGAYMPTSKIVASPTLIYPSKNSTPSNGFSNYSNGYHVTSPGRQTNDVTPLKSGIQQQNDDSSSSSSPLSFLYDRAQGESYYSPGGAVPVNQGTPYSNPYLYGQINSVGSKDSQPPSESACNYGGTLESRACPTGSYQNNLAPSQYSIDIRQRAVSAGAANAHPAMTSSRGMSLVTSPTTPTAPCIPSVEMRSPQIPATAAVHSGPTVTSPTGHQMGSVPPSMTSPMTSPTPSSGIIRPTLRSGFEDRMAALSVQYAGRPSISPSRDRRANSCAGILDAVQHDAARKPWSYSPDGSTNYNNQQMNKPRNIPTAVENKQRERREECNSSDDQLSDSSYRSQDRLSCPGSDIDKTSIRYNLREGDEIGQYDQESIRYMGHINPSKAFRLLQSATGSDTEADIAAHQTGRRLRRRAPPTQHRPETPPKQNSDDIVDISYVGSCIPSRTFRFLQQAIGDHQEAMPSGEQQPNCHQPRNVKVVYLRRGSVDNIL